MVSSDQKCWTQYLFVIVIFIIALTSSSQAKPHYNLDDYDFDEIDETNEYLRNLMPDFSQEGRLENSQVEQIEHEGDDQLGMMDTFEKFKRQAERVSVPGDESGRLSEYTYSPSELAGRFNWQTATIISVMCVGAAVVGVVLGVVYWPKSSFGESTDGEEGKSKDKKKSEIGAGDDESSDRSLAQSAQMYHYQQQKQQMLAMELATGKVHMPESDPDSEGADCDQPDENVYECPGLAAADELEVKNPLFQENLGNDNGAVKECSSK